MNQGPSLTARIIFGIILATVLVWVIWNGIQKIRSKNAPARVVINWSDWLSFNTTNHVVAWFQILASAVMLLAMGVLLIMNM